MRETPETEALTPSVLDQPDSFLSDRQSDSSTANRSANFSTEFSSAQTSFTSQPDSSQLDVAAQAENFAELELASATAESAAAYQEGIDLAASARSLSESAFSPDDWGLIASRWDRAAAALARVSEDDANYVRAQAKILDYRQQSEDASAQIERMQTPIHVPLPDNARTVATVPSSRSSAQTAAERDRDVESRSAAPTETAATTDTSRRVTVPIVRRLHGTPVVRVTFNNARTYEMILDTGASRTLITRQMANELGVVITDQMIAATASSSEVSFDVGRLQSISLGEITLSDARVSIGDSVSLGLLGNDFLRGYDVTIRARTNVVELTAAN